LQKIKASRNDGRKDEGGKDVNHGRRREGDVGKAARYEGARRYLTTFINLITSKFLKT
jgi:hypothetical protein